MNQRNLTFVAGDRGLFDYWRNEQELTRKPYGWEDATGKVFCRLIYSDQLRGISKEVNIIVLTKNGLPDDKHFFEMLELANARSLIVTYLEMP